MNSVMNHSHKETNKKRDLWVKRRPSLSLKGIAKAPRQRPEEEIQQKRMKRSVSPRVCQHETAVRRGLYLTNALYYSRLLEKALCSVRLDEKDPDWMPPFSEQIRTL